MDEKKALLESPDHVRDVYLYQIYLGEVGSGGHGQLYYSSSGYLVPEIIQFLDTFENKQYMENLVQSFEIITEGKLSLKEYILLHRNDDFKINEEKEDEIETLLEELDDYIYDHEAFFMESFEDHFRKLIRKKTH